MLVLFAVATLGLSGFAAWFFFGGPEDDPTRVKLAVEMAEIEALKPQARSGDMKVQYALARLYHTSQFGSRDLDLAYEWYSKAAEQGHPGAQYFIGTFFADAKVVKQSYYRASEWYRLAANLGRVADAQLALGDLYFHGRGVPHDYAEALGWYKKAAEQGHPVAQYLLGSMYQEGWAGDYDPVEAYKWFTLAHRQRDRVLTDNPKFDTRAALDRVGKGMNQDQIKRAEDAARNWRPNR